MDDLESRKIGANGRIILEQQKKALEIKSVIDKTDKEIDTNGLHDLYGLTRKRNPHCGRKQLSGLSNWFSEDEKLNFQNDKQVG
ncbi:MAG: hypothetical protein R2941_16305 [Desulfobacterales bacterium]